MLKYDIGKDIKKANELVYLKSKFNEIELKLFNIILNQIIIKREEVIELNLKELTKILNIKDKNYYDYLKKASENLITKYLKYEDRKQKKFIMLNLISRIEYNNGVLKIFVNPYFKDYVLEIKENYLKFNIKFLLNLTGKYTIRLYDLLKDYYERNRNYNTVMDTFVIKIDKLREILGVPNNYVFSVFKERVLDKAKQEFKEKGDITFKYFLTKKGRKYDVIEFKVELNFNKLDEIEKKFDTKYKNIYNFVKFIKKNYNNNGKSFYATFVNKKPNFYFIENNLVVEYNSLNSKRILLSKESKKIFEEILDRVNEENDFELQDFLNNILDFNALYNYNKNKFVELVNR